MITRLSIKEIPFHLLFVWNTSMIERLDIKEMLEKEWVFQVSGDKLIRLTKIQRENKYTYKRNAKKLKITTTEIL